MITEFSVITCEVPEVTNGLADPIAGETGDYGTAYTVTCNEGYQLVDDESDSGNCASDGSFASPAPECERKSIFLVELLSI